MRAFEKRDPTNLLGHTYQVRHTMRSASGEARGGKDAECRCRSEAGLRIFGARWYEQSARHLENLRPRR